MKFHSLNIGFLFFNYEMMEHIYINFPYITRNRVNMNKMDFITIFGYVREKSIRNSFKN